jgi:hypothetical protein
MAYIWHNPNDDRWTATELHSAASLSGGSIEFVQNIHVITQRREVLLYPTTANARATTWALLAPADSDVRINDALLENGIRIIVDRDAIRVANAPTAYFSTERLACIEAYPDEAPVFCPRCKLMISESDLAVCCSQCGVWHHEQAPEGKSCWSYSKTCALCDQSTDLDSAGFRWTPEVLWP